MKSLCLGGLLISCLLFSGCGTHNTEISPATTKIERSSVFDKFPDNNERVIEVNVYPPGHKPQPAPAPQKENTPQSEIPLDLVLNDIFDEALAETAIADPVVVEFDGKKIVAPEGSTVQLRYHEKDQKGAEKRSDKSSAESKGAGLKTDNSEIVPSFKTNAPEANLDGIGDGSGGSSNFAAVFATKKASMWIAYVFALLMVVGAAFAFWLKQTTLAVCLLGGAVLCAAVGVLVETYPWVFLLVFLALLVAAGFFVWYVFIAKRNTEVLKTVVQGVEEAGDAATPVKEKIAEAADETGAPVKKVVTKLKDQLGL